MTTISLKKKRKTLNVKQISLVITFFSTCVVLILHSVWYWPDLNDYSSQLLLDTQSKATTTSSTSVADTIASNVVEKRRKLRYVTLVLFSTVNPEERLIRLQAISETWGPSANVVFVVQNTTDYHHPIFTDINSNITNLLQAPPVFINKEGESFSWNDESLQNRVKLMVLDPWVSIEPSFILLQNIVENAYKSIISKDIADFIFLVNDHTYVIAEHVCAYLKDKDPQTHMHAGHALLSFGQHPFNSGPTGILLSKTTITELATMAFHFNNNTKYDMCVGTADHISNFLKGNPELLLTACLTKALNIPLIDTRDDQSRHRFHSYGLVRTVMGDQDDWYINFHKDENDIMGFENKKDDRLLSHHKKNYSLLSKGRDCCSPETATFHYVQNEEARALHSILNAVRGRKSKSSRTLSDKELKTLVMKKWPRDWNALGGYSKPLPKPEDSALWAELLSVIRAIAPRSIESSC